MKYCKLIIISAVLLLLQSCGERIRTNQPLPNPVPPVMNADAGANQTLTDDDHNGNENVQLNASASTGNIIDYVWELSGVTIGTGVNPLVNLAVGTHIITLIIDDGTTTTTDTVTITVNAGPVNNDPIANAGPDQMVVDNDYSGQENIQLDGSASSDPDVDVLTYTWREGVNIVGTGVNPNFNFDVGVHTVVLTVDDGNGGADTDTVIITVDAPPNSAPDLTVPADSTQTTAQFNVTATANDIDGDAVSITWMLDAGGPATQIIITDPENDGSATITVPRNGTYQFTVSADDGSEVSTDTVSITVNVVNSFSISANVMDGPSASQTASENVNCQLHWNQLTANTQILLSMTDVNGDTAFTDLIGSASDFELVVED